MRFVLATLALAAVIVPANAQNAPKKADQVRERVNKAWDAQLERIRNAQIASKCKAEAKKQYWAIRFNKRRMYEQDCAAQARTIVVDRAGNIP
jgi:predicted ATPase with chaperone activity